MEQNIKLHEAKQIAVRCYLLLFLTLHPKYCHKTEIPPPFHHLRSNLYTHQTPRVSITEHQPQSCINNKKMRWRSETYNNIGCRTLYFRNLFLVLIKAIQPSLKFNKALISEKIFRCLSLRFSAPPLVVSGKRGI